MTDSYSTFVNSGIGAKLAGALALPRPAVLRRHRPGALLTPGAVLVDGHGFASLAEEVRKLLGEWDIPVARQVSTSVSAVVLDLTELATPADLESVRSLLAPALKTMAPSGRVLLIGRPPLAGGQPGQAAARAALTGIVRSVAKEVRSGGTANLIYVADAGVANLAAPLRFFLSGRSAYVDGQVVEVGAPPAPTSGQVDWECPLAEQVAVVTGAARRIGAQVARVLARDGARVVCVDMASAGDALARVANDIGGSAQHVASLPRMPAVASSSTRSCAMAGWTSSCTKRASQWTSCSPTPTPIGGAQCLTSPALSPADERKNLCPTTESVTEDGLSVSPRSQASPAIAGRRTTPRPRPA